jgi:hypothetical protein
MLFGESKLAFWGNTASTPSWSTVSQAVNPANFPVNKMARQLNGNAGKYADVGSITA